MPSLSAIHLASLAAATAALIGLSGPAGAAVVVDAEGASVQGPEATGPARDQAARSRGHATVVMAPAKRATNLRKSATFLAVLGPASVR